MLYLFLFFLFLLLLLNYYIFDPFHIFRNSQVIRIEDSNVIINSDKIPVDVEELNKIVKENILEALNENEEVNHFYNFLKNFDINNINQYLLDNIENEDIVNKIKENNMYLFRKATDILPELHKSGDKLLVFNKHIIDKLLETNIDPQIKKEAIIKLLDLTLIGDGIASNFLHIYQEFVRHIM